MFIGLHDAEKEHLKNGKVKFPNYALMKLSAWHKAQGDTVEWWLPVSRYDRVYSSKVFDFTPETPYLPVDAVRGGTGYRDLPMNQQLPAVVDNLYPDYSIYPEYNAAIGYITRGCPNKCRWCVVPQKEGRIQPYRPWQNIVRTDVDKLILMDNNILASDYGISQLEELSGSSVMIDLNQGMDARLVNNHIAKVLSRLRWIRFIRFSCDQKAQLDSIRRTIDYLGLYGVKPYRIFVYLLVTPDIEDAAFRVENLKGYRSINLYAQAERNERLGIRPNAAQLEFQQRYMYSGCYRRETWGEYCWRKRFDFEKKINKGVKRDASTIWSYFKYK